MMYLMILAVSMLGGAQMLSGVFMLGIMMPFVPVLAFLAAFVSAGSASL